MARSTPAGDVAASIAPARAAKDRARAWLLDQVAPDGTPAMADRGNSWSRLPWAFALCGETAAGHAVLGWATRHGVTAEGGLAQPAYGSGRFGAYPLGHLAMGSLLLERHDVARRVMDRLAALQTPTGGFPIDPPGGEFADLCDLLSTAQAGAAAVLAGRRDVAAPVWRWIAALHALQPTPTYRLFSARRGEALVTEPPQGIAWVVDTDFSKPRQTYFTSGIAAVFLAAYGSATGEPAALEMGHRFLRLNITGTDEQFSDLASVQACKFGWGLAAMHLADPRPEYVPWLQRMVTWFVDRQAADGSWAPSTFLAPEPSLTEKMVKTAEHVMELDRVLAALVGSPDCALQCQLS